jgi:beta-glucanase (GH16 family)
MKNDNLIPLILPITLLILSSCIGKTQCPPKDRKWKLVWNDEFNGIAIDTNLWFISSHEGWIYPGVKTKRSDKNLYLDGNGNMINVLTKNDKDTILFNHGITSKYEKAFGYFEARVKFSTQPGWWTAFWLSGYPWDQGNDCFTFPQEFDIYEDYNKPKRENDILQCYHANGSLPFGNDKEWDGTSDIIKCKEITRHSLPLKSLLSEYGGWHTVALEWTPLEHIFYIDGKESYRMTYRECPITTVPQRIWLSGLFNTPSDTLHDNFYGNLRDAKLPDQFMVDYVRVYDQDWDDKKVPLVTLTVPNLKLVYDKRDTVEFSVNAKDDDGSLKRLYLFSKGRLRAEITVNSKIIYYTFKISNLFPGENSIIAMAKDNDGRVGLSAMIRVNIQN